MEHSLANSPISPEDDRSYYVTWNVFIALAVPKGEQEDSSVTDANVKKTKKGTPKVLKAQACYHIEYTLLPGDDIVKVDLVLFGPVAKLYREQKIKILRVWHEGHRTWVGWTQDFNVRVNRDVLIRLQSHELQLHICNSRTKAFCRAQFDALKTFQMPHDHLDDETDKCGGIKVLLPKLRTSFQMKANKPKKHSSEIQFGTETEKIQAVPNEISSSTHENIIETGSTSVTISPIPLLAGEISLTKCFSLHSSGVLEVICNISLDRQLLSDQMKAELNPLVITVLEATSMPSSPVPFHILQEKCMPVYCQYKFHNLKTHRTNYQEHATNIYFQDVNVIFTGLMSPVELQEYLSGTPMEIEVHDRDIKLEETAEIQADDAKSSAATSSSAKCWPHSACKEKTNVCNSYGIARVNLSELLLGSDHLKLYVPIKYSPPPQPSDGESGARGRKTMETMPPGRYVDANSQLKIKIEIAYPLVFKDEYCGAFGRMVYIFSYNNTSTESKLRSEILRINAEAFRVDSHSQEYMERALSNYNLTFKQDQDTDVDFVSGFHMLDRRKQIFVLEGLRQKALKRLWEAIPNKLSGSEEQQVIVLYNSKLGFFKRMYDLLDMSLRPICLHESLETIMRQPLTYIRGVIPKYCFQAMSRLSQLCQAKQLTDAVRNDLFPSADMVLSMSQMYGIDVQRKPEVDTQDKVDTPCLPICFRKRYIPVDMYNTEYINWKHSDELRQSKNFIEINIKTVQDASKQLLKPESAVIKIVQSTSGSAKNYSIQTFNSNRQTKEVLCKYMAKEPGRRFTYSQQYHSATVEPGNVTSAASTTTTALWDTSKSQKHPKHPDEARVEELRKPWRENILHGNTLKPTLSRDIWACNKRSQDFQLHSKPPAFFSTVPVTIFLAGESLKREQLEADRALYREWLRKLRPGSSVHLSGFKCDTGGSSGKFQDILKDEPKKYSLSKPGMVLKPFPKLSVINSGSHDKKEKESSSPAPVGPGRSLRSENTTATPRHKGLCQQHSFLHKRTILPLTEEEKRNFTFLSDSPNVTTQTSAVQQFKHVVEVKTHKGHTLYTK